MPFKAIFILATAMLAISCSQKSSQSAFDRDEALAEIDALRARFEQAVSAGDMAALSELVTPDAIMLQPGADDWKTMQSVAAGAPFPQGAQIKITPFETRIMTSEWAFERGSSVLTYDDPETGEEILLRDSFLLIFRNDGYGWKIFREVASASQPPEGWPASD